MTIETDSRPDPKPTTEFLDRVYPIDIFGPSFNRKQVAWIMATYVWQEISMKYWLTSKEQV